VNSGDRVPQYSKDLLGETPNPCDYESKGQIQSIIFQRDETLKSREKGKQVNKGDVRSTSKESQEGVPREEAKTIFPPSILVKLETETQSNPARPLKGISVGKVISRPGAEREMKDLPSSSWNDKIKGAEGANSRASWDFLGKQSKGRKGPFTLEMITYDHLNKPRVRVFRMLGMSKPGELGRWD